MTIRPHLTAKTEPVGRFGIGPDAPRPAVADGSPLWALARQSVDWLDGKNGRGEHEMAMRLMKLVEEAGEVMAAYIGMRGQNPRKSVTHNADDVAAELCDVIITAATALHGISANPEATLNHHVDRVSRRIAQLTEGGA